MSSYDHSTKLVEIFNFNNNNNNKTDLCKNKSDKKFKWASSFFLLQNATYQIRTWKLHFDHGSLVFAVHVQALHNMCFLDSQVHSFDNSCWKYTTSSLILMPYKHLLLQYYNKIRIISDRPSLFINACTCFLRLLGISVLNFWFENEMHWPYITDMLNTFWCF